MQGFDDRSQTGCGTFRSDYRLLESVFGLREWVTIKTSNYTGKN